MKNLISILRKGYKKDKKKEGNKFFEKGLTLKKRHHSNNVQALKLSRPLIQHSKNCENKSRRENWFY